MPDNSLTVTLSDKELTSVIDSLDNEIVVVFDMWGQRCITTFNGTSELTYLEWLRVTSEKGWLLPIEVYEEATGLILYDRDQLSEMLKEG